MSPSGFAATDRNEPRNRVASDVRAYTCDNCGYQEKVANVNEELEANESKEEKSHNNNKK